MTTKTVTLASGKQFTIAPLTLRQVRAFGERSADPFAGALSAIAQSLNNAGDPATEETLQDALTFPDFQELQSEVLTITGLKTGGASATV